MPATVSHAKSNTLADWAGTVTVANSAGATVTAVATDLVRPLDWNSGHNVTLNISATEISGLFSNANGISFGLSESSITGSYTVPSVTQFLTTAMLSNAATISNIRLSAGTTSNLASAFTFADSNGVSFGLNAGTITGTVATNYLTTAALSNHSHGISFTSGSVVFQTLSFTNSNGVSFNSGTQGIFGSHNALTTAMASNRGSDFVQATAAFAGTNASGTIASGGISVSVAAGGAAGTFTNCYEPFDLQDGTATLSGSLSQLNLQPFILPNNISFGQINFIGIGTVPATSASNSHSARLTNSTQRYTFGSSYTIGNTNLVDWFLFSRGAGVSTSELQTFASTRNSFITHYLATYNGGCTLTNTAGGSVSGSQTVSMTISYPFLTSYTSTSVSTNSTYTGYSSGYTTWTSGANNNSTFTISTSAARTLSIGSTYPATVGWSGAKRINMNFATSLTAGEYWLGYLRHSSSSSSSSSANAFTGAAGTGNSYSATFNHTAYANTMQLTFVGKTATVVNSLGSLGFVTTNNMAVEPGLGSFSGTWASNTIYLNNMANPAGAIALTQIRSNVSMFRSWFQLASNMPV